MRPLGVGRPVRDLRSVHGDSVEQGKFVMWKDDGSVMGGVVITVGGNIRVHVYEGNEPTARVWLPLWRDEDECVRRREHQKNGSPFEVELEMSRVLLIGDLTKTHRLVEETREMAERMHLL